MRQVRACGCGERTGLVTPVWKEAVECRRYERLKDPHFFSSQGHGVGRNRGYLKTSASGVSLDTPEPELNRWWCCAQGMLTVCCPVGIKGHLRWSSDALARMSKVLR
jgi:hypothetical protein